MSTQTEIPTEDDLPEGSVLRRALTDAGSLSTSEVEVCLRALDEEARQVSALRALCAILYGRPDLIEAEHLPSITRVWRGDPLWRTQDHITGRILAWTASSSRLHLPAWRLLFDILNDSSQPKRWAIVPLIRDFVDQGDGARVSELLQLARALPDHRTYIFDYGLHNFVFRDPEGMLSHLSAIDDLFQDSPRYRFFLRFLAARHAIGDEAREHLLAKLRPLFPKWPEAQRTLRSRPLHGLVVINQQMGQGDELVKVVPCIQALLDAHPEHQLTIVAKRTYLYEHPRCVVHSLTDVVQVRSLLPDVKFDVYFEVFQKEYAYHPGLQDEIRRTVTSLDLKLELRLELGQGMPNQFAIHLPFTFLSVKLNGKELVSELRLDERTLDANYDAALRLLAELDLPQRVAEETPAGASALTGSRSADVERFWDRYNLGDHPVALVNPFGGASPCKGFHRQPELLARELRGLMAEGYRIAILPNGTPWGGPAEIQAALDCLEPSERNSIVVLPDSRAPEADQHPFEKGASSDYADSVFRLFKHVAQRATLVVTVEGWLAHLAYFLGRPLRIFLAAGSYNAAWYPYGRGPKQTLVTQLSPLTAIVPSDGFGDLDPPALPHGGRKPLLMLAFEGLGTNPLDFAIAEKALHSPELDLRAWSVALLGRATKHAPDEAFRRRAHQRLLTAIEQESPTVALGAARALLLLGEAIPSDERAKLETEVEILEHRWDEVSARGPKVIPILARHSQSSTSSVASGARRVLRTLLQPFVPKGAHSPKPTESALQALLANLLSSPSTVPADDLAMLGRALALGTPELVKPAIGAAAALVYARPEAYAATWVESTIRLCRTAEVQHLDAIRRLVDCLASTSLARHALGPVLEVLDDTTLSLERRAIMGLTLVSFANWHVELFSLDQTVQRVTAPELEFCRPILLDHPIERLVYHTPESFSLEHVQTLWTYAGNQSRLKYILYSLGQRQGVRPDVRAWIDGHVCTSFPHHDRAAQILRNGPFRIFVALNTGMGQGDDIVRIVPIMEALLETNPNLTIDLATWRPYLYDNPRVTCFRINDDDAVSRALADRPDAILEFFQPGWPPFTFRLEAHQAIEKHLSSHEVRLFIWGDLGRLSGDLAGGRSPFLHNVVRLDGQDIAESQGLKVSTHPSIYDPARRLLAELGLPQRLARDPLKTSSSVLTGTRSPEAERLWSSLIPNGSGPVALLNVFGGSGPTKGFLEQDQLLGEELTGLVQEGYRLVVISDRHPWSRPEAIERVLSKLPAEVRSRITVTPDPSPPEGQGQLVLEERPELSYGDKLVRVLKYFTSYADLVVSVEGWLAHFAYNLGSPFRLLPASGSFGRDWYPNARGPGQELVPALSPLHDGHARSGHLGPDDPPALPHANRKFLFMLAIESLEGTGSEILLKRALKSPDPAIRERSLKRLGPLAVGLKSELLAALHDRSPAVVQEAATALLAHCDCTRELGAKYKELLQVEIDITQQRWIDVQRVGPPALPALFRAVKSSAFDVEYGAKELLKKMLPPFVPRLNESEPRALDLT